MLFLSAWGDHSLIIYVFLLWGLSNLHLHWHFRFWWTMNWWEIARFNSLAFVLPIFIVTSYHSKPSRLKTCTSGIFLFEFNVYWWEMTLLSSVKIIQYPIRCQGPCDFVNLWLLFLYASESPRVEWSNNSWISISATATLSSLVNFFRQRRYNN